MAGQVFTPIQPRKDEVGIEDKSRLTTNPGISNTQGEEDAKDVDKEQERSDLN